MTINNDQHIIDQIKNGDTNAFSVLVDRYKDLVYTLALRMVKNREEAETMQGLYPPPTPVTWLRTNHIEQDLQQNIT